MTIGVSLVMTTLAGRLSVSTGWTANDITERDKRTLRAGSVGGETCHQVAALVGASELLQCDGMPELSNAEGKTPSDSFIAVVGEGAFLGTAVLVETSEATPTSAFSARTTTGAASDLFVGLSDRRYERNPSTGFLRMNCDRRVGRRDLVLVRLLISNGVAQLWLYPYFCDDGATVLVRLWEVNIKDPCPFQEDCRWGQGFRPGL